MFRMSSFVSVTVLLAGSLVLAQQPEQPVFRSTVRTVPIYATVVDAERPARARTSSKRTSPSWTTASPPTCALFSNESQPFTAVVMLDTSASMTANLKLLNRAAEQFLLRLLPVDRAQVGAFNDKIQLSGTFTNNRDELIGALNDLYFGNPTRLNDGIAAGLDALQGIDGRRVVLVFTDGEDTSSRLGFKTVLERARDEEVMVYSIGLESEYFNGMRVVQLAAVTRPAQDLGRDRRRLLRAAEDRRPRADLHARRAGAPQSVPDWVCARRARRQGAQARSEGDETGDDGAGA